MIAKNALDEVLTQIDSEITALEARVSELQSAKKVLTELIGRGDVEKSISKRDTEPVPTPVTNVQDLGLRRKGLSIPEAAEIVLRAANEPLKARDIADRLLAGGFHYKNSVTRLRESIGAVLRPKVKEGDTFTKVDSGTFGLLEWERRDDGLLPQSEIWRYQNRATSR